MWNTDVFGLLVFRGTSYSLHTGTPLVDCAFKVFICETTLEVRTSDNRDAPLLGRSCNLPVPLECRITENSPARVKGPDFYFIFFSVKNIRKASTANSSLI